MCFSMKNSDMKLRIGQGYDVHQLAEGYKLWIGGIEVPYKKGSVGHSDGDVLLHVICDAMLGALNMRDIGYHFPDTAPELSGIDSKILLEKTYKMIRSKGYEVNNIDATVCLQKPKLKDLIPEMQRIIAHILEVDEDCISIKATTTEQLGFVGREEGVEAHCVILLVKK